MQAVHQQIESIAKILIINKQNEVLVLTLGQHLEYPEESYLPDLPGGIVDPGESEQDAVIREANEECGIVLHSQDVKLAYSDTAYHKDEDKSVTKLLYVAYIGDTPSVSLSWEHSDYRWVTVKELQATDLRPFFNEAIQYLRSHDLIKLR